MNIFIFLMPFSIGLTANDVIFSSWELIINGLFLNEMPPLWNMSFDYSRQFIFLGQEPENKTRTQQNSASLTRVSKLKVSILRLFFQGEWKQGLSCSIISHYKQKDSTSVTELKLGKRRLASFHFSCFFDKPNEFQDNNSCYAGRYIFCGSYD